MTDKPEQRTALHISAAPTFVHRSGVRPQPEPPAASGSVETETGLRLIVEQRRLIVEPSGETSRPCARSVVQRTGAAMRMHRASTPWMTRLPAPRPARCELPRPSRAGGSDVQAAVPHVTMQSLWPCERRCYGATGVMRKMHTPRRVRAPALVTTTSGHLVALQAKLVEHRVLLRWMTTMCLPRDPPSLHRSARH